MVQPLRKYSAKTSPSKNSRKTKCILSFFNPSGINPCVVTIKAAAQNGSPNLPRSNGKSRVSLHFNGPMRLTHPIGGEEGEEEEGRNGKVSEDVICGRGQHKPIGKTTGRLQHSEHGVMLIHLSRSRCHSISPSHQSAIDWVRTWRYLSSITNMCSFPALNGVKTPPFLHVTPRAKQGRRP